MSSAARPRRAERSAAAVPNGQATTRSTADCAGPLALTPGEPAGIGPDLALDVAVGAPVMCYADPGLLAARAALLGRPVEIAEADDPAGCGPARPGVVRVVRVPAAVPCTPGRLDPANARYVLACLDAAADACVRGDVAGLVTGPVQKSVINEAGIAFTGHTEYLAARVGAATPVMLLAAGELRVALATTHLPLSAVPAAITRPRLLAVLEVLHAELANRFGLAQPRIAVCGLNPHAGEGGHLGREELDVIGPVVETCRARGWAITGPVPADTVFTPAGRAGCDAVLAMYHDQGLSALKALGFGQAVNVTLGLPILRTSVDHGTALDLAGTGRADPASLGAAVALARTLACAAAHARA